VAQPPAPEPYSADLAFDVLTGDTAAAGCSAREPRAPSRVRELGDGRLLSARRRIDASGRLIVPAFVASVHGLSAGAWLDAPTLAAIGRLGVGRLSWHVAGAEQPQARELVRRLAGEGRPAVEVVDADTPPARLRLAGPPATPRAKTLAAALDALTSGSWRCAGDGAAAAALLGELVGASAPASAPAAASPPVPLLAPDRAATLLLLRASAPDAAFDPERLDLEAVFIDGREPAAR
jgi:hypothetical protein